jgi:hypothetical protein
MSIMSKDLAGIQYWGEDGITQECLDAIMRFLQYDDHITDVKILSDGERYCLLLTLGEFDLAAIKSGFSYGYPGEGPRKFSLALALLEAHKIPMDEYEVGKDIIERINKSALTTGDLEKIKSIKPVRPLRIYDYIEMDDYNGIKEGTLWNNFRPVIPFAIIDPRIMDLAISFWKHPDANLNDGYRRFEDTVRGRIKSEDYGYDLFKKAFLLENSVLGWKDIANGEKVARANLIIGAYSAYRNPRAHKEKKGHSHEDLSEFLLLNHLFRLESQAVEK